MQTIAWVVMPPTSKLIESDSLPFPAPPPALASASALPSSSPRIVCDVSEVHAFSPGYKGTHVAVVAAFGADRLHECRVSGLFDLDRAIAENSAALFRSVRRLDEDHKLSTWDDLTFQFGPRSFLYADETRILGYAETSQEAERLASKFGERYKKPPLPKGGSFYLIRTGREISRELVELGTQTILSQEAFSLHYGQGSHEWHADFTAKMHSSSHGLSIFEGPPGTGKTSYLRHLMGQLKDTHRFYVIPTATMSVLSNPDFIGFWAEQRRRHADRQFVVILEDSDAALMTRGADNRDQVSAILNLSDGMLADFLRLQIICTINCKAADIDQALLRPGRLLCHRIFQRLDYPQASRLAESLGKQLHAAQDYSLAEVFAGHEPHEMTRVCIGFAT